MAASVVCWPEVLIWIQQTQCHMGVPDTIFSLSFPFRSNLVLPFFPCSHPNIHLKLLFPMFSSSELLPHCGLKTYFMTEDWDSQRLSFLCFPGTGSKGAHCISSLRKTQNAVAQHVAVQCRYFPRARTNSQHSKAKTTNKRLHFLPRGQKQR